MRQKTRYFIKLLQVSLEIIIDHHSTHYTSKDKCTFHRLCTLWMTSIFFTSTSKNLGATGCGCDLAQGKVTRGLLVHVSLSRVLGAHTWCVFQPECHTGCVDILSNTRIYMWCTCTRLSATWSETSSCSLGALLRGTVWFMWEHENVWHSCERFTNCQHPKF